MKKLLLLFLLVTANTALGQSNQVDGLSWNPFANWFNVILKGGGASRPISGYEIGYLTPSFSTDNVGFAPTYVTRSGWYVRQGKLVNYQGFIQISAISGSPSGSVVISMGFQNSSFCSLDENAPGPSQPPVTIIMENQTYTTGQVPGGYMVNQSGEIRIYPGFQSSGGFSKISAGSLSTTAIMHISGFFKCL